MAGRACWCRTRRAKPHRHEQAIRPRQTVIRRRIPQTAQAADVPDDWDRFVIPGNYYAVSYGLRRRGIVGSMGSDPLPPVGVSELVTRWQFAPVVTGFVVVAAGLYLWGVLRVRRRHPARPWPLWRTALFLGGLAVVVIATEGRRRQLR